MQKPCLRSTLTARIPFFDNPPARATASLTDGSVVQVMSLRDGPFAGADHTKVIVQIIDGDDSIKFVSAPFRADYLQSSPTVVVTQNLTPVVAVLPDGGFAVAWVEFTQTTSLAASRFIGIKLQRFSAGGGPRGAEQTDVSGRSVDRDDLQLIAIAHDRLVLTMFPSTTDIVAHVLDEDGATLGTTIFDGVSSSASRDRGLW